MVHGRGGLRSVEILEDGVENVVRAAGVGDGSNEDVVGDEVGAAVGAESADAFAAGAFAAGAFAAAGAVTVEAVAGGKSDVEVGGDRQL